MIVNLPGQPTPDEYFDTRYEVLRKPLGSPKGSERLAGDENAINVWVEIGGTIAAVGRSHLLKEDEDGSVVDIAAKSNCPAFEPLSNKASSKDDEGNLIAPPLRPAVQIRAMGTLQEFRGQGLASIVLNACEQESLKHWSATTGWLQARTEAIPFYVKNGWVCFGPEYYIPNVGPHRSMWKKLQNLNP